jgi:hypothetical protein
VTPVAALGIAVRTASDERHKWVHNRTLEGSSRWTYCGATVTEASVSIVGAGTSAEAAPDGALTIDVAVPADIARRLRDAYDAARGVVEPSRIAALIDQHLARAGGRRVADHTYLLPELSPATCGALAGLSDLGGWAVCYPLADSTQIEALTRPVVRSIEEQIADVIAATEDFLARAAAACEPDGPLLQRRSADTVRADIAAARAAAELWRDRLGLASLDVDGQLAALTDAADEADKRALAAVDERRTTRAATKAVRAAETLTPETIAHLDDVQATDERRTAGMVGGVA